MWAPTAEKQTVMGFGAPLEGHDYDSMRDKFSTKPSASLNPSSQRLDEIIVFHSLGKRNCLPHC